jgi:quercetin dioxygenase-like cupin family protein
MIAAYEEAIAQGIGAVTFEGKMIDVPVVERAKALLAQAERFAVPANPGGGQLEESKMRSRIVRAAARPTKKAPAANFTGLVLQDEVFLPEAPSRMRASKVTFTPGARTNWHTHAVGQVLHVLSGGGRYQIEGDPVQVLLTGDTVVIPQRPATGMAARRIA